MAESPVLVLKRLSSTYENPDKAYIFREMSESDRRDFILATNEMLHGGAS